MAKKDHIIVSGIKPSGRLHIANYVGAVRNWIELQDDHECNFFIADYHQMSESYDAKTNRKLVLELATDLLAAGLDPKKCTLFVQSAVPEHTELFWIFNTVTPVSFLERMTQFKDKSAHQVKNINAGLMEYPVLQAADVLIYDGDRVPVGKDQVQHIELTRDIGRFFNKKFGDTFPEAEPLLTDTPKLRSLTDPLKKMSKSHGEKSYISMSDDPKTIHDKLKRAVTESTGVIPLSTGELEHKMGHLAAHRDEEEMRGYAGVWNLLTMLRIFGSEKEMKKIIAAQPIKYGELKKLVAERIAEHLKDFRSRRAALAEEPGVVWKILEEGAEKARTKARKKMDEVREKVGLR